MPVCVGPGAVAHVEVAGVVGVAVEVEVDKDGLATQYQSPPIMYWHWSPTPGLSW